MRSDVWGHDLPHELGSEVQSQLAAATTHPTLPPAASSTAARRQGVPRPLHRPRRGDGSSCRHLQQQGRMKWAGAAVGVKSRSSPACSASNGAGAVPAPCHLGACGTSLWAALEGAPPTAFASRYRAVRPVAAFRSPARPRALTVVVPAAGRHRGGVWHPVRLPRRRAMRLKRVKSPPRIRKCPVVLRLHHRFARRRFSSPALQFAPPCIARSFQ